MLIGGLDLSTYKPTNLLWTSTNGLDWESTLPAMPTRRYYVSSVSGGSPEVLVVAGGCGLHGNDLDVVEVLVDDHWMTADPLPIPCNEMQSTFHESNFYFTGGDGKEGILFTCTLDSLIASTSYGRTSTQTLWNNETQPFHFFTVASYLSHLISVDKNSTLRSYSDTRQVWMEPTSVGDIPREIKSSTSPYEYASTKGNVDTQWLSTAVLSTGELMIANKNGVYKGTLSGKFVCSYCSSNYVASVQK